VFELCPGGSLLDFLDAHPHVGLLQRVCMAVDCASSVDFMHDQGWLHRDLKLANFLLNAQQRCLLTDLGSCVHTSRLADAPCTAELIGTLEYMAPELLVPGEAAAPRYSTHSDTYALAVCLFGVLALEPVPFPSPLKSSPRSWEATCWPASWLLGAGMWSRARPHGSCTASWWR
jgi:serine/threonine protein kinase